VVRRTEGEQAANICTPGKEVGGGKQRYSGDVYRKERRFGLGVGLIRGQNKGVVEHEINWGGKNENGKNSKGRNKVIAEGLGNPGVQNL